VENFQIAGLTSYGITGWGALCILIVMCGFVGYGATEASKTLYTLFHIPQKHSKWWQWGWRVTSVLSAAVWAALMAKNLDMVVLFIGSASGGMNAYIVKMAKQFIKVKADKLIAGETPEE
jgi:hypothetical protein